MIYSFKSRIRYSETDKNSELSFPALLDYFQDTSTFHGEDNQLPLDFLFSQNITWVLGGWQVRIFKPMRLNDFITVSTWAHNFRQCLGFRNYSIKNEAGELTAVADTQYVLINLKDQTPVRIPEYMVSGYGLEKDAHIDLKMQRKIRLCSQEERLEPVSVQDYMIDANNHVNNSQYVKTTMLYLPKDFSFNCFRCEYKKQARIGDTFYPAVSQLENGIQIKLYDADDSLFFAGEWTTDNEQTGESYASNR